MRRAGRGGTCVRLRLQLLLLRSTLLDEVVPCMMIASTRTAASALEAVGRRRRLCARPLEGRRYEACPAPSSSRRRIELQR